MARKVSFRLSAEADVFALYDYLAPAAGTRIAGDYISRIEAACMRLADFPERGTARDDLAPGLRTVGFERRVTIAFRVLDAEVEIVAVAYGGRNFEADFHDNE